MGKVVGSREVMRIHGSAEKQAQPEAQDSRTPISQAAAAALVRSILFPFLLTRHSTVTLPVKRPWQYRQPAAWSTSLCELQSTQTPSAGSRDQCLVFSMSLYQVTAQGRGWRAVLAGRCLSLCLIQSTAKTCYSYLTYLLLQEAP